MGNRISGALDRTVEVLIMVIFICLVVVGGMQVFNRFVLNRSLSWSEEFQKFAHIWIVFLAIPVGYNRGAHIGMDSIVNRFPDRTRHYIAAGVHLLWAGLAIFIVIYTRVIMRVASRQISPGLGLRMDFAYLGLFLGGAYLFIIAVRKLIETIRNPAAAGPTVAPAAVPHPDGETGSEDGRHQQ